uniref:Decapping nuclease n=1 Tax=Steinernema glaseri TaxID=37863 RepID=A0A1I8A2G0_9BILA
MPGTPRSHVFYCAFTWLNDMSERRDIVMRFDRKLYHQLSLMKGDFWFAVEQHPGFSTVSHHVPTVQKGMINVQTSMCLLEGYGSATADMKIDRTHGLLKPFQLSLIGINGGSRKIAAEGGFSRRNLMDCGFMSTRAALVRIGMRVMDNRNDLNLVAVRRNGIIFLQEIPTAEHYDGALKNEYVGHRFRQIMTVPKEKDPHRVTSFTDEHFGIQKVMLGKISVLCRSVVDCIADEISYEYIELKTHRVDAIGEKLPLSVGWLKSIRWWLQMKLTGMNNMVVGLRDANNILRETIFAESGSFLPPDFNKTALLASIERCLATIERYMARIPEGTSIRFFCPRHGDALMALSVDHDFQVFHPLFEKLLVH